MDPTEHTTFWSFATVVALIVQMIFQQYYARQAVKRAAEVKTALDTHNATSLAVQQDIKVTGEKTHILVDGRMGFVLRANALIARRLAEITKNSKDLEIAREAEALARDHDVTQAAVDRSL